MSSGKCKNCGYSYDGQPKFCPECGSNLKSGGPPRASGGSGRKNPSRDTMIVIGAIVIATLAFIVYKMATDKQAPGQAGPPQQGPTYITPGMLDRLPEDYNALVSMGNQFMDEGNFPVAVEVYGRALKIQDNPNVRTDMGACYHAMGQDETALAEFRRVLAAYPDHGIATFNSGIVHFGMGQNDSARYYWERYLDVAPDGRAAPDVRNYLKNLGE